jgi:hypothetical protein
MALPEQIDRAAARGGPPVGFDAIHRDAILAMPATERAAAIEELQRARRYVLRVGGEHAGELLDILGLGPSSPLNEALAALERERVRDFDALTGEAWPDNAEPETGDRPVTAAEAARHRTELVNALAKDNA